MPVAVVFFKMFTSGKYLHCPGGTLSILRNFALTE